MLDDFAIFVEAKDVHYLESIRSPDGAFCPTVWCGTPGSPPGVRFEA